MVKSTLNNNCPLCIRRTTMSFSFDYTFSLHVSRWLQNCTQQHILFTAAFLAYHKLGETPCTLHESTLSQHGLRPRHSHRFNTITYRPTTAKSTTPLSSPQLYLQRKGSSNQINSVATDITKYIIIYHFFGSSTVTEQYKYFY